MKPRLAYLASHVVHSEKFYRMKPQIAHFDTQFLKKTNPLFNIM